ERGRSVRSAINPAKTREPVSVLLFLIALDATTNQEVGCSNHPGRAFFIDSYAIPTTPCWRRVQQGCRKAPPASPLRSAVAVTGTTGPNTQSANAHCGFCRVVLREFPI